MVAYVSITCDAVSRPDERPNRSCATDGWFGCAIARFGVGVGRSIDRARLLRLMRVGRLFRDRHRRLRQWWHGHWLLRYRLLWNCRWELRGLQQKIAGPMLGPVDTPAAPRIPADSPVARSVASSCPSTLLAVIVARVSPNAKMKVGIVRIAGGLVGSREYRGTHDFQYPSYVNHVPAHPARGPR